MHLSFINNIESHYLKVLYYITVLYSLYSQWQPFGDIICIKGNFIGEKQQAALRVMKHSRRCLLYTCTFKSFKPLNLHLLLIQQQIINFMNKGYYICHHTANGNFFVNNKLLIFHRLPSVSSCIQDY